jgi:hypothetical protein
MLLMLHRLLLLLLLLLQNPDLPADVFTACLTTPIKVALRWFCSRSLRHDGGGPLGCSSSLSILC